MEKTIINFLMLALLTVGSAAVEATDVASSEPDV